MSVSQIIQNATTKYVDRFKNDPEGMALSYAYLGIGFCLAYGGLIYATKIVDKQDRQITALQISHEKIIAYSEGLFDGYKACLNDTNDRCSCKNSKKDLG